MFAAGFDYEIAVLETYEDPIQLLAAERWWVLYGRLSDWPLTNLTDGGEGTTGRVHSEETKAKIAAKALLRFQDPEKHKAHIKSHNTPEYLQAASRRRSKQLADWKAEGISFRV